MTPRHATVPAGVRIRPWRIEDVPDLIALAEAAGATDAAAVLRAQAAHQRLAAEGRAGHVFLRLVADCGDGILGTAVARDHPFAPGGWLDVRVHVEEANRRHGIGSALADALDAQLTACGPTGLVARVDAGDHRAGTWAERRGFARTVQEVCCVLDPRRAPASPGAMPNGVNVFSLADVDASGGRRLAGLVARLLADMPEMAGSPGPHPDTVASALEHLTPVAADATWIAASGDEWVGVTVAGRQGDDGLYTWFTGVDPRWRGAGIASALKRWAVAAARAAGVRRMVSEVAVTNAAMLAVNQALGATFGQPVWVLHRQAPHAAA